MPLAEWKIFLSTCLPISPDHMSLDCDKDNFSNTMLIKSLPFLISLRSRCNFHHFLQRMSSFIIIFSVVRRYHSHFSRREAEISMGEFPAVPRMLSSIFLCFTLCSLLTKTDKQTSLSQV